MTSRFLLVAVALATVSCGTNAVTEQPRQNEVWQTGIESSERTTATAGAAVMPQNSGDRTIRRELNLAIDRDTDLKDRDISFIVNHGDVSVTGIVRNESERERINELAMGIPGVRSVANALRVSE